MRAELKIDPDLQVMTCSNMSEPIKVIISYTDRQRCLERLNENGLAISFEVGLINAFVVDICYPQIFSLAQDSSVSYVSANIKVKTMMNVAGKVVGSRLLNSMGWTGKNIGVAIIDTGIYPHNDFIRNKNRIKAFVDFVNNHNKPYDDNGHGTYVAGIVAGSGYNCRGTYRGIAPDADIISIKAMNGDGGGETVNILKGMQWIYDNRVRYKIRVLILAFGAEVHRYDRDDALVRAVNKLWERGIVVVVAAGNSGPAMRTINTPGISPKVITVGSIDDKRTLNIADDTIADFSSRGPVTGKYVKPDVVAPGVNVVSTATDSCYIPGKRMRNAHGYTSMSGTSVSTPIVAGMCALILEKNPLLTPDEVKSIIKKNAISICHDSNIEGNGLVRIK